MDVSQLHLVIGWSSMIMGALSGAVIGLFFHRDEWAGGYSSFRRRMLRLGHIAFFGLGFLNLMFGLTTQTIQLPDIHLTIASAGFMLGVVAMPACCFLAAWRKPFRHLFPIPVVAVMAGIVPIVLGGI
ncbi:MAG: hypothetical protein GY814_06645 [Gammaproteobacteria bacterium]|nr:hypothetical protein [Gammaproteobacteria bacterium]